MLSLLPLLDSVRSQLSLSARYPGIKKELESFLGVPRQIDRGAKRYPKTPKPSLNHPTPARLFADDSPTHGMAWLRQDRVVGAL